MARRHPLWGNFVFYADYDLLSFAALNKYWLIGPAMYHAVQAIEKYLKALTLAIVDPDGDVQTPLNNPWVKTHDLFKLASRCADTHPYYGQESVSSDLRRFTEFDQATRYPWLIGNMEMDSREQTIRSLKRSFCT